MPVASLGLVLSKDIIKPEPKVYSEAIAARRLALIEIRAHPAERSKLYQILALGLFYLAIIPGLKPGANVDYIILLKILISASVTPWAELTLI